MAGVTVTGSAVPAFLVALLACAAARVAVVGGASPCDGVSCGMGTCVEVPLVSLPIPIPGLSLPNVNFKCVCEPGWSQTTALLAFLPCTVPICSTGDSCFNITLKPPNTNNPNPQNICEVIDLCGSEGTCVAGKDFLDFKCQCNPGATNLVGSISPCICVIGNDGCPVPSPPSPPPPTSPAPPPGNPDSSGPTPPSSTEGNATSLGSVSSLHNLMLPLLLTMASFATVQIA